MVGRWFDDRPDERRPRLHPPRERDRELWRGGRGPAPTRIVFTYGFNSGDPIPARAAHASRSTWRRQGAATRLDLVHEFAEPGPRDEHVQGWRYQLSVFGNVVSDLANAGAADQVDAWFGAWSETNENARRQKLATVVTPEVRFRDRFSLLDGLDNLVQHIGATQRFMPDMHLRRQGDIRHCQGTLLVDWAAMASEGSPRGSGTNVFALDGNGKIVSVTGFWDPPKPAQKIGNARFGSDRARARACVRLRVTRNTSSGGPGAVLPSRIDLLISSISCSGMTSAAVPSPAARGAHAPRAASPGSR